MRLPGEGDIQILLNTRVRRECDNCASLATERHTYLNDGLVGARNNPESSAYHRDDCTWCSDLELFLCSECERRNSEENVPKRYHLCSTFSIEKFPGQFLYWKSETLEKKT